MSSSASEPFGHRISNTDDVWWHFARWGCGWGSLGAWSVLSGLWSFRFLFQKGLRRVCSIKVTITASA